MHDPFSSRRRSLARAVLLQAATVVVVALGFLVKGPPWSLGALAGGGVVVTGAWLSGRLALGRRADPAAGALLRVLGGVLVKWCVVLGGLLVAVVVAGLPPVAVLVGVVAALVVQMATLVRR